MPPELVIAAVTPPRPEAPASNDAVGEAVPPDAPPSGDDPAPAKADPGLHVLGYRENVSASGFHAAVNSNGEVPPLKKLQPSYYDAPRRNVSPMSTPDIDPRPRREYAVGTSALDELNPNRKVNQ